MLYDDIVISIVYMNVCINDCNNSFRVEIYLIFCNVIV